MKVVQINQYGGNEVLEINKNVPKPNPSKNQVLVEVYAASINPIDWKIREGYLKGMAPLEFPATLGGDFAGRVIELGEGVSGLKVGDEVYGSAIVLNGGSGAFAEFLVANTSNTAYKPSSVSFEEASALPLVGASAIQALEDHIKLQNGPHNAFASRRKQKILIHGGAGGIGHIAIQLAKAIGAHVATTVSSADKGFVKELGADEVIDYKTQKFEEILKDMDSVFDTVGGETTNKSFLVLRKGGIIVSMVGEPNKELAKKYGISVIGQFTQTNRKHLTRLGELVDSGRIKVHVDKVFSLGQAKEAFAYQEEVRHRGKVVFKEK